MNRKTPEERLKEAQRIVARYVAKDRDLVAELIAERRAGAAAEDAEAARQHDDGATQATASEQPSKSERGNK